MSDHIDAATLKSWLSDGREIALLDVREHGQYGEGHLFFAVPLPYSVFELKLSALVPNPRVRLVLYDNDDGVAERALRRARDLGFENVSVLRGGAAAWEAAGNTLFAGVFVPSKTFGELVEIERQTPHVTAEELKVMIEAGENMVIVDGRPFDEFRRVSIPGGLCCPNGELALRIDDIAPDPETTIVVNCAGRTRSIVGAQILIDLGIPNPVVALENGTQGWSLAGLQLENGASRRYNQAADPHDVDSRRARARVLAESRGVRFVETSEVAAWLQDDTRSTYLIDIRTGEEYEADGSGHMIHAPGGQLIQATDQWIGVRGARLVLADSELIRAPIIAGWLRQLGHEAYILTGGVGAANALEMGSARTPAQFARLPGIDPVELGGLMAEGAVEIVDLRPGMTYRQGHIDSAKWSIRPGIDCLSLDASLPVILVADQSAVAELAAIDLREAGIDDIRLLDGGVETWRQASLPIVETPDIPADADCIDFLFFTHRRLVGDAEHSRQYLAWEIGLVDQLHEDERAAFNIVPAPQA